MLKDLINNVFNTKTYEQKSGNLFEKEVANVLKKLSNHNYIVLNDILLRTKKRSIQIDHIVLSYYGIFVIESKNYSGMVYGSSKSNNFTQYIGNKYYKFYNPIYQNYSHIKILSDIFGIPEKYFISIVCFSSKTDLRVKDEHVIKVTSLLETIGSYNSILLEDNYNIVLIAKKLKAYNVKDSLGRKEHVQDVKEKMEMKQDKIDMRLCPRCHGNLLVKHGKYGDFLGCSNYPKCHFKERIN